MLDTRKITPFTKPQSLVELANRFSERVGVSFSDWGDGDANFIVTQLLLRHISEAMQNVDALTKITSAVHKAGFPVGRKLLILSDEPCPTYIMWEATSQTEANLHVGYMDYSAYPCFSIKVQFRSESQDLSSFGFGEPQVDPKNFLELCRRKKISPEADPVDILTRMVTGTNFMMIFLLFVEVETVFVQPKERYRAKKYEDIKNAQPVPIKVADLSWSRETVNAVPFGVSGHFRNQPFGPGRSQSKLIYIEPFVKHGYTRKAGKKRILGDGD